MVKLMNLGAAMDENKNSDFFNSMKKNNRINLYICLAIIICASIYYAFSGGSTSSLEIGEDSITITGDEEFAFSVTVMYSEVQSVELVTGDEFDIGTMVSGYSGRKLFYGTWNSPYVGEYYIYASPKVTEYVLVTTGDFLLAVNLESDTTTEAFYTAIIEMLEDSGYNVSYSSSVELS